MCYGEKIVRFSFVFVLILQVQLALCAGGEAEKTPTSLPACWPIDKDVFTTAQHQVLPVAISPYAPEVQPSQVPLYVKCGYGSWRLGDGTNYSKDPKHPRPYDLRAELAPGHKDAPDASSLWLSFFCITDIHITDKESPAQPINPGWSSKFGPSSRGLMVSSYSPVILSTSQVLDAAIQTVNALHEKTPFAFGISLGDDINNTQYNELRWFIDVLDGKIITPSSGDHAGADYIDYQQPYKAAGLDKTIPWYQTIGNHDQYWSGVADENKKTRDAHIGNTILNIKFSLNNPNFINETGEYMGVVNGATPYGNVVGAGPQESFTTPPTVIADDRRHSLSTNASASRNWMREFFVTTSEPLGHGFTKDNLDKDFACYSFEPKSGIPLKVIVLDDTNKRNGKLEPPAFYGSGYLDKVRLDWLKNELQKGQDEGKFMIIAAHIPIKPQASLTDTTITYSFYDHAAEDELLATLHNYPNLIMWMSGHRHMNIITAQPNNASDFSDHPERSFWEVETASLRDFPQQLRTFDIRLNSDNTISIFTTDVDPAVTGWTPASRSRQYAIGAARIFGATPEILADTTSHAYNAELVKQLSPEMQAKIANGGSPAK